MSFPQNQLYNLNTDNHESLINESEKIIKGELNVDIESLLKIAKKLIYLYDNPLYSDQLRTRAAKVVCILENKNNLILELIIENAKKYATMQHIDDAFPYSPNSFEVLSKSINNLPKIIVFLISIVKEDYGIPRWDAIKALCNLNHPDANYFLSEIVKGKYPSRYYNVNYDLSAIESVLGREYIDKISALS